jgi:hypothetical protein
MLKGISACVGKRIVTRVLVLSVFIAVFGTLEAAPVPKSALKPCKFPAQLGTEWVYDCSGYNGNRDAVITDTVTLVEEEQGGQKIQISHNSAYRADGKQIETHTVTQFWVNEEGVFEWLARGPEFCLLKLPYRVGDTWEREHRLWFNRTASRVVSEEKVKVPAGTFDCVCVETKAYADNNLQWTEMNWYASGIGLVKHAGGPNEKHVQVLKKFTLGKD